MPKYENSVKILAAPVDPEGIRREAAGRILAGLRRRTGVSELPGCDGEDLAGIGRAGAEVRNAIRLLGTMPPRPPTTRGRVGAWMVRLVRRALWWYTDQIVNFQSALSAVLEAQGKAIEVLAGKLEGATDRMSQSLAETRMLVTEAQTRCRSGFQSSIENRLRDIEQRLRAAERDTAEHVTRAIEAKLGESETRLRSDIQSAVTRTEQRIGTTVLQELNGKPRDQQLLLFSLRNSLLAQERRLSVLLSEVRKKLAEAPAPAGLEALASQLGRRHDALYAALQDEFRGTRQEIKDRLRVYVPKISDRPPGPLLDIGCGRGEWLELLRENGIPARGIDNNREMVARCADLGLDVMEAEAISYLRSQPESSYSTVTMFHVVEHLPFDVLIDVLDEIARVLMPGGIAIFETPDPENVLTSTHYFYLDPTHRNPVPSLLLRAIVEARGLCDVDVMKLHPWPQMLRMSDSSEAGARLNEMFYGSQDYAVIGRKP